MPVEPPRPVAFAIGGPIRRGDLAGICDRVCALLERSRAATVLCDVSGVGADAIAVDALARLQLAARRYRCQVRLRRASDELVDLVAYMGLTDVLPEAHGSDEFSSPAPSGQAERLLTGGAMASATSRKIFVNLPVASLERSVQFFTALGFEFDPRFTDETATCMIVSDEAFVMLLVESRFKDFTKKQLADASKQTEAIVALSAESREGVDELAEKALEAGGSSANEPMDLGFMYGRSFQDPDGHIWEVLWMDPSALEQRPAAG